MQLLCGDPDFLTDAFGRISSRGSVVKGEGLSPIGADSAGKPGTVPSLSYRLDALPVTQPTTNSSW